MVKANKNTPYLHLQFLNIHVLTFLFTLIDIVVTKLSVSLLFAVSLANKPPE